MNHNVCLSVCPKKNYRNVLTSEFLVNVVFVYFFLKTPPRPCFHLIFLQGVGRREVKKMKLIYENYSFYDISHFLNLEISITFALYPYICKLNVLFFLGFHQKINFENVLFHNIIILFTTLYIAEIHFLFTLLILKAFKTICNKYLGYIFGLKG